MNGFGKCLGYTGTPCPNCDRYRLERYENGKEVCEKCNWCPQENRYVEQDEIFPLEENEILKGGVE
jgi:ribosomal protein L37AE/L43A